MPRNPNHRQLNATVTVEQYSAVTEAAAKRGMELAEFIRAAVGEAVAAQKIEWPELTGRGKYRRVDMDTVFVMANERFGDTQIFAKSELENAVLEMGMVFGDDWNEDAAQAFRDAAEYFDLGDEAERAEFYEYYGAYATRYSTTESAREIIDKFPQ